MSKTVLIANPASGRGRGARLIPAMRDAFAATGVTDLRVTEQPGDESALTHAAIMDGATTIVVLGGDGTWSRCASAVLDANAGGRVRLAFLSGGTGNDFAKNLGAPDRDFSAMARLVADPTRVRSIDAGMLICAGTTRWFLNCVGFGFDVAVLEDTSRGGQLGGNAVYITAALKRLLSYEGFAYTMGGYDGVTKVGMLLVIMNGSNFGGAFRIAPNAKVSDGYLDCVEIGSVSWLRRIPLFLSALRGNHVGNPAVRARRGVHFELSLTGANACELDGELTPLASRDVTVRCAPSALRVVA